MSSPMQIVDAILHPSHQEGKVRFILTGSAGDYNITYKCNEDRAHQEPHARRKWRHSFTARNGEYVYFSAQSNEPGAEVRVKIVYNGKVFKESKAAGDYALALAGGCLC